MSAIERGEENTTGKINWFTLYNGALTDMYSVGFQIWDISGGIPGSQVFPSTPGAWEDVTNAPGRFGTGSYYAYDNANAQGWTPGVAEPLGTHRIKWRWKVTSADSYREGSEDFEVVSVGAGPGVDYYVTVQDVRDEGVTVSIASDGKVLVYIQTWQEILERACRQWFRAQTLTIQADGNDSDTLFFGVPIISIEYLKINGATAKLDTSLYKVYSGRRLPDHRHNPKISLVRADERADIYTAPLSSGVLKFRKGRQNQEIKGDFGFVEDDGSPPLAIKRALLKLVIEKLTRPIYDPTGSVVASSTALGAILQERTDGHSIRYSPAGGGFSERRSGLSGLTQDTEILDIIKLYRAPLGIATPSHWSYN